jgi:hypothetical protein
MPTAPTEFTLNADIIRLVADTADVGADMDVVPITGLELYFVPDLDPQRLLVANVTPRPQLVKLERVTGYIRSNGRMYDQPSVSAVPADVSDPGNVGVRLLASGAELNLAEPLTYQVSSNQVSLNGTNWGVTPWHIPAPATDITIDLASVSPVNAGNGVSILTGPPGPGADAVRLNGSSQVVFSYQGVDIPVPLSITPASVPDNSVTTVKIVDANVTLAKLSGAVQTSLGKADTALQSLATDSVGSTQIAANAVGSSELANNAVDTAAIVDANVTLAKLSSGVQTSLGKADTAVQIGGDLGGTSTSPVVAKVNGITVTTTPSTGQVLTATGTTAATWQAAPSGFANPMTTAGDLIVRDGSGPARKAVGTNSQVLRVNTANADKLEYATLAKVDVGLGNVDNTSDVNKPVSTAQSAANDVVLSTATGRAVAFALVF